MSYTTVFVNRAPVISKLLHCIKCVSVHHAIDCSLNYCFSIEEDFITWKDSFWPSICEKFGVASVGEDIWYAMCFYVFYGIHLWHTCVKAWIIWHTPFKLPIVNRPSHSSVTDASGVHLRFQGPELAVCRRCLACHMGSHSIPCHQHRRTHPCFIYGRRARPLHITAATFPAVKPVLICTAWWTCLLYTSDAADE